jgi:hypothetical protein
MDKRFLMYEGFNKDAKVIFQSLQDLYGYQIKHCSDSGISLENRRCVLDISYETGIQVWLKVPKYNIEIMLPKLAMIKGEEVYKKYKEIVSEVNFNNLIRFVAYLNDNFSLELSE